MSNPFHRIRVGALVLLAGAAFTADLASSFRSAIDQAGLQLTLDCADLGEPVYVDRDMWE